MTPMKNVLLLLLAMNATGVAFAHGPGDDPAFGQPADPNGVHRTVRVEMKDTMRFSPARIVVRQGEAVRFVPINNGKLAHEMVLGTRKELEEHAALMKKFPDMEHDEPNMAHVPAGKTGRIDWRFTRTGTYYFACLVPGHFDAGMVGRIIVKR
jgi:uncharacterized cupredoxin-like copper-binding protein